MSALDPKETELSTNAGREQLPCSIKPVKNNTNISWEIKAGQNHVWSYSHLPIHYRWGCFTLSVTGQVYLAMNACKKKRKREKKKPEELLCWAVELAGTMNSLNKRWNLWNPCHHLKTGFKPVVTHSRHNTWMSFWYPPAFIVLIQLRTVVPIKQLKTQTCTLTRLEDMKKP